MSGHRASHCLYLIHVTVGEPFSAMTHAMYEGVNSLEASQPDECVEAWHVQESISQCHLPCRLILARIIAKPVAAYYVHASGR